VSEIVVRLDIDGKWGAFYGEKRIVASGCKGCVVTTIINVTRSSSKYQRLVIQDEEGKPQRTVLLGINAVRPPTPHIQRT